MPQSRFVLTTVGTSLLLNSLTPDENPVWRNRLNNETNAKTLPPDLISQVEELQKRAVNNLRRGDVQSRRQLSAELNGIYAIYENQLSRSRSDTHWLITTDTAMGAIVANTLTTFLREEGIICDVHTPPDLSTSDAHSFSKGIKSLLHWCEQTIPPCRDGGQHIIFNLTGGFKSLQGYLTIAGMFYADQVVYIFEKGSQLLSIPRLPIRVDIDALYAHRMQLAMMAEGGHVFPIEQVADIPAGMLDVDNSHATLSDWGLLVWNRARKEMLSQELLGFPRLEYERSFRKDFDEAEQVDRVKLHETLAKVSSLLEGSQGDVSVLKRHGGVLYSILTSKKTSDGRSIDHFRVSQSLRVTCVTEGGTLRLRRFGGHEIEQNP